MYVSEAPKNYKCAEATLETSKIKQNKAFILFDLNKTWLILLE